ncbi:hypothetical protein BGX27_003788 [Mortierella sp. AM989]|nr:hypothetical protein BGX27_003788 [Mortierella sp. AM989]
MDVKTNASSGSSISTMKDDLSPDNISTMKDDFSPDNISTVNNKTNASHWPCSDCTRIWDTERKRNNHWNDLHAPTFVLKLEDWKGSPGSLSLDRKDGMLTCPHCLRAYSSRSALQKHYKRETRGNILETESENEINEQQVTNKKRKISKSMISKAKQDLIRMTTTSLPLDMVKCTTKAMNLEPFYVSDLTNVQGFSVFVEENCGSRLSNALHDQFILSPIDISDDTHRLISEDGHMEVSVSNMEILEAGGIAGLEQLSGALLITGSKSAKIVCLEVYGRNRIEDPHAEAMTKEPSSVPTSRPCTQYPGRLKLITLQDSYKNNYIAIGVRDFNYLVTALESDGVVAIGPANCAEFAVNNNTNLFISKKRVGSSLAGTVSGLAQVRSNFGHPTTYTTRRGAAAGYASISQLPLTIFTLWIRGVKFSKVFYQLWERSRKAAISSAIVLHLDDVENPDENDTQEKAESCRTLRSLFGESDTLVVSPGNSAEKILSDLASLFSSEISKQGEKVAHRNNSSN